MDDQALWPDDSLGLLVAVSGGADSMALLLVLERLARRRGQRLVVAQFDHGLRGRDVAEAEAQEVQALANRLELDIILGHGNVSERARFGGLSIEDAARRERYAFLARAAHESACSAVATGHTASDQAETVLLHLVRGAGLAGLAGMRPKSSWPFAGQEGLSLTRPLLTLSREDTRAYCAASEVTPIEDESNASPAFLRNRVRHELLPLLESFNPRVEDALVRLADSAGNDVAYLESLAAGFVRHEQGYVRLERALLAESAPSLRRHALRLALGSVTGDVQGFSERHVVALERLLLKGHTGDRLDLSRGIVASLSRQALELRSTSAKLSQALPDIAVELPVPGEVRLGHLAVAATAEVPPWGTSVELDAEAVRSGLVVRRRRKGDRFQPLGMTGSKKLQDFFVDSRIPRADRDAVPIFEAEGGIAWIGGLRIAEWAKPRPGHPAIYVSYRPLD
jgi:tRNA(Ile)-lysidine synthase